MKKVTNFFENLFLGVLKGLRFFFSKVLITLRKYHLAKFDFVFYIILHNFWSRENNLFSFSTTIFTRWTILNLLISFEWENYIHWLNYQIYSREINAGWPIYHVDVFEDEKKNTLAVKISKTELPRNKRISSSTVSTPEFFS